jgi:hypothetical protein
MFWQLYTRRHLKVDDENHAIILARVIMSVNYNFLPTYYKVAFWAQKVWKAFYVRKYYKLCWILGIIENAVKSHICNSTYRPEKLLQFI